MQESDIRKSRPYKLFWLIIPIVVLISIQFLVVAQVNDYDEDELIRQNENNDDYNALITKTNLNSHYLFSLKGQASHYATKFHNRKTASGERFDMFDNTAAHRKLPFGTIIKVTNLATGKATLVRINDRGPHLRKRVLDLSYSAAKELEGLGLPQVKIEGFLRGKHQISLKNNMDYFYAYSLSENPVCIPANITQLIDSTKDFQEAFDNYKKMLEQNPMANANLFLFVHSDKSPKDEENYYYIGRVGKTKSIKNDLSKL